MARRSWTNLQFLSLYFLLLFLGLVLGPRIAKSEELGPAAYLKQTVQELKSITDDKTLLRRIAAEVDYYAFTSSVLKRHWHTLSPSSQNEAVSLYTSILQKQLQWGIAYVRETTFSFDKQEVFPDGTAIVYATAKYRGEPTEIVFRMRSVPSGWKIYDVEAGWMKLAESHRAQAEHLIKNHSIQGFLTKLREKAK